MDGKWNRIVVGLDGSEGARRALRFALEEAGLRGASVVAVMTWEPLAFGDYLVPPIDVGEQCDQVLVGELAAVGVTLSDRLVERGGPGLRHDATADAFPDLAVAAVPRAGRPSVQRLVRAGSPVQVLVDLSAYADLLVVGNRGRGAITSTLLGSVSRGCTRYANCPVVVVRPSGAVEAATPRVPVARQREPVGDAKVPADPVAGSPNRGTMVVR